MRCQLDGGYCTPRSPTVPTHVMATRRLSLNVALYDARKEGKRSVAVQLVEDGLMDGMDEDVMRTM